MFLFYRHLLPCSFLGLFATNNRIHSYNSRRADIYSSHACRTDVKLFSFLFQAPKVWNSLPKDVKRKVNLARNHSLRIQHKLPTDIFKALPSPTGPVYSPLVNCTSLIAHAWNKGFTNYNLFSHGGDLMRNSLPIQRIQFFKVKVRIAKDFTDQT